MLVKVILVDINPKMIGAWRDTFEENPEVEVVHGSMLEQDTSAWVTPTNARARMDGGLDAVIRTQLGDSIQQRVFKAVAKNHGGVLPVGFATCVETGHDSPKYLISTPTMVGSSDNISDTLNVALACAAAFQAIHIQNMAAPGSIRSIALPGLGAATGRTPVEIAADLMWTGYNLFRRRAFADFSEMRAALEAELGDLGPVFSGAKSVKSVVPVWQGGNGSAGPSALPKTVGADDDFDDDEGSDDDFDDNEGWE